MKSDRFRHPDESQDPLAQATISGRYAIGYAQKWSQSGGICRQPAFALMAADFRQHDDLNAFALPFGGAA
jgi:hypothetical protein